MEPKFKVGDIVDITFTEPTNIFIAKIETVLQQTDGWWYYIKPINELGGLGGTAYFAGWFLENKLTISKAWLVDKLIKRYGKTT